MPLAGIIGPFSSEKNQPTLELMVKRMSHEAFHHTGTHHNAQMGVSVGWVVHAGTFADNLPIWNEQKNVCLLFSGEVFPDAVEIQDLRQKGHAFEAENASYIVHAYEESGLEFLNELNGSFSGILLDLRENKIILFNDRYGLNRIYFHESEDRFYFASEAKALLAILPETRRLDQRSLGEFFSCGCALQNRTLFHKISLLPAGSAWTFYSGQAVRKEAYFKPASWENQPQLPTAQYYEQLEEAWKQIVPRYFRGQDKVGLSLTGGVDSRMILAWVSAAKGSLPCYTFGGKYRDCADVAISRELARACGQPHQTIAVDGQFLSKFPELAARSVYISDGTVDVTGAIDLYVQGFARKIAPVRVTGTNGGEILRHLVVFHPTAYGQEVLAHEMAQACHEASVTYAQELKGHRLSFTAFKQAPWYMASKFGLERSQITLRMPYFDNDLVSLAYQAPPGRAMTNDISMWLVAQGNPALAGIQNDRGESTQSNPAVARVRRLIHDFTFRAEYAYDYGMPQWLAALDHAVAPLHLEKLILGRHKFHHFRPWYRNELAPFLKEVLLDSRTLNRAWLRRDRIEEMVNGHIKGNRNYTVELHKLLGLELIQRQLIEQN